VTTKAAGQSGPVQRWSLPRIRAAHAATGVGATLMEMRWLCLVRDLLALSATAAALSAGSALAQDGIVLHEYIDPRAEEDLALGARVAAGTMPAALKTTSGAVSAPDLRRIPGEREPTYTSAGAERISRFRIDSDTTDPGRLRYHEPFDPGIAPFKRGHVFDAVDDNLDLRIRDQRLHEVRVGGTARSDEDQFYANLVVGIDPARPTAIPSVASGMRVLAMHATPERSVELFRDGAENWYVRAQGGASGEVRLVLYLTAPRAALDDHMDLPPYRILARSLPPVPEAVRTAARPVLSKVGIGQSTSPNQALSLLVSYFRNFSESDERPSATRGIALYQQLALSQKGVCRHRAYGFVLTALAAGIPARFVHNEAHAWVEVFDGTMFHRVDLGGAATGLDFRGEPPSRMYRSPRDVFDWPKQARSGATLSSLSASSREKAPNFSPAAPSSSVLSDPTGADAKSGSSASPPSDEWADLASNRPNTGTLVEIRLQGTSELYRGDSIRVTGLVKDSEGPCDGVRIELQLLGLTKPRVLSEVVSDTQGRWEAELLIPTDISVGDYRIVAETLGNGRCGPGSSK